MQDSTHDSTSPHPAYRITITGATDTPEPAPQDRAYCDPCGNWHMVFYDLDEAQAQYIINQLMYWVEMPPASGQYDPATRIFRLDMPAMAEYWHPRQKFIDRANRVAFKSRHPAMREYLAGISEVHVPVLVGEGA